LLSKGLDGRFAKDLLELGFHKNREKFSAKSKVLFQWIRIYFFNGFGRFLSKDSVGFFKGSGFVASTVWV
jgi:hypothetical protein